MELDTITLMFVYGVFLIGFIVLFSTQPTFMIVAISIISAAGTTYILYELYKMW